MWPFALQDKLISGSTSKELEGYRNFLPARRFRVTGAQRRMAKNTRAHETFGLRCWAQ